MNNIFYEIYVQTEAKETEIAGTHSGRLKVRLKSPPADGKANQELINFFTKLLNLKKKDIQIVRGKKSRFKLLSFPNTSDIIAKLKALSSDRNI